jgi:hypothetical protein
MNSAPYLLKIKISKATDVPDADPNGKSDPYVVIYMDGKILGRTQTILKNLNPTWNYISESPFPLISRFLTLSFRIFDRDEKKNDDYLGVCEIPLNNIELDGVFYPLCLIPIGFGKYIEKAKACRLFVELSVVRNNKLIQIQPKTHENDVSSTLSLVSTSSSASVHVSPFISRLFSHKYLSFDKSSKLIQNAIKKICSDFSFSLSESLFYDILLEISKEQFPTMKEANIMENGFISRNSLKVANYPLKYHFNRQGECIESSYDEGKVSNTMLSSLSLSKDALPMISYEESPPISSKQLNSLIVQFKDKKEHQVLLSFQHRLHCWNFLRILFLFRDIAKNDGSHEEKVDVSFLSVLLSSQFYVRCSFSSNSSILRSQEMNKVLHFSSSSSSTSSKRSSFFLFIGDLRFSLKDIDWISSSCDSVLPSKYCFSGKVKVIKDSEANDEGGTEYDEGSETPSMSLLSWKNQTIPLFSSSQRVTLDCEEADLVHEGIKVASPSGKVAIHEISFNSSASSESCAITASLETPLMIGKEEENSKKFIVKVENLSFQHSFGKKQSLRFLFVLLYYFSVNLSFFLFLS